jgi:hypothetical protein
VLAHYKIYGGLGPDHITGSLEKKKKTSSFSKEVLREKNRGVRDDLSKEDKRRDRNEMSRNDFRG